jgi:hypothetical protein
MPLRAMKTALLGFSGLALAIFVAGCRSDGPPPGDAAAGYYTGKMAPNGRGAPLRGGASGGGRAGSAAPKSRGGVD